MRTSIFIALLMLAGCSAKVPTAQETCTFTNPIGRGQDPFVVRHGQDYYYVESRDGALWVYRSRDLTDLKQNGVRVWSPPATGWNRSQIWAPELHYIDGSWYIYYAAGESGPPFIHQKSGVLRASDPQGAYEDLGMLVTGDDVKGGDVKWAIDLTVQRLGGRLYAVWSGWEQNATTDKTPQHLYIARMSDPATISSDRVKISSPVESWETGGELDLNEGPQFLLHGEDVFVIYSTRESWLKEYRLGQLRLERGADPMDPAGWVKSGPVFQGTDSVLGTGHASFTTSPDGREDWIVYHTKAEVKPGWNRIVHAQPFTWKPDGSPGFGTPVPAGHPLPTPSGHQPTDCL